ncbi:MAG: hypothetical protein PHX27_04850, partial [Candidatus ainarchaeum sp.]|nr:hypothetical protein [Candidatus ainarchaeum sp.]
MNFSTDSAGLVTYISEYISGGKTKLTITGVEPGTATISVRSLQGGITQTINVRIIQPIENLTLNNDYVGTLYAIKGDALNLNSVYFYNFTPVNTNEKDLNFEIKTQNSECTIEDGFLYVGEDCDLDKVTITAASTHNENIEVEFEIKILKPITASLEYNYVGLPSSVVEQNANNYLKIYSSDPDKSLAVAVLTINAGTQTEILSIDKIFDEVNSNFLISQTNYEYTNNQHIYTYTIQSNASDAGSIDSIIFNIYYKNYTIGEE